MNEYQSKMLETQRKTRQMDEKCVGSAFLNLSSETFLMINFHRRPVSVICKAITTLSC